MGKQSEKVMKKYLLPILFILSLIFPADASAGSKTKAQVLSYLTSLPSQSNKKVLSGQFIGWCGEIDAGLFDRIHSISGKYPGLMSANYQTNGCSAADLISGPNSYLKSHWAAGGLVEVAWHPSNPASNTEWDQTTPVNLVDLVINGTTTNTNWKSMMDVTATALQDLKNNGVVVIFRPFLEMNGNWFWWGSKNNTEFKNMWIYTYNYLTTTKGLTNLIWTYATGVVYRDETDYYPGSSYVDIVGYDYYPLSSSEGGHINWVPEYDTLRALGKPFALTELGQCYLGLNCDTAKDASYIISDIKSNMPNTIYWSNWNDHWALDKQTNLSTLLSDPWVINRDDNPSGATDVQDQSKKPSTPARISIQ